MRKLVRYEPAETRNMKLGSGEAMNIDLKDKVALVTGGSKGIGRETCVLLAKSGAEVIINFNRSKEKAEAVRAEITNFGG